MLETLRKEIDRIDSALIPLLLERFERVGQIAAEKQKIGINIIDPEREAKILRTVAGATEDPVFREQLLRLYRELLECSHDVQRSVLRKETAPPDTGADRE